MADRNQLGDDVPLLGHEVLRAAATETVPSDVSRRTLERLDLLAITPQHAVSHRPLRPSKVPASSRSRWAWGLALTFGAASAAAAVTTLVALNSTEPPTQPPTQAVGTAVPQSGQAPGHRAPGSTPNVDPPSTEAAAPEDRTASPPTPPRVQRTAPPAAPKVQHQKPVSNEVSLRDEIDLLDRARNAMARGAPDEALSVLAAYKARHPTGQLRKEVAAVRADALRERQRPRP